MLLRWRRRPSVANHCRVLLMTRPLLLLIVLLVTVGSLNALPASTVWFAPYLGALMLIGMVAAFHRAGADDDV